MEIALSTSMPEATAAKGTIALPLAIVGEAVPPAGAPEAAAAFAEALQDAVAGASGGTVAASSPPAAADSEQARAAMPQPPPGRVEPSVQAAPQGLRAVAPKAYDQRGAKDTPETAAPQSTLHGADLMGGAGRARALARRSASWLAVQGMDEADREQKLSKAESVALGDAVASGIAASISAAALTDASASAPAAMPIVSANGVQMAAASATPLTAPEMQRVAPAEQRFGAESPRATATASETVLHVRERGLIKTESTVAAASETQAVSAFTEPLPAQTAGEERKPMAWNDSQGAAAPLSRASAPEQVGPPKAAPQPAREAGPRASVDPPALGADPLVERGEALAWQKGVEALSMNSAAWLEHSNTPIPIVAAMPAKMAASSATAPAANAASENSALPRRQAEVPARQGILDSGRAAGQANVAGQDIATPESEGYKVSTAGWRGASTANAAALESASRNAGATDATSAALPGKQASAEQLSAAAQSAHKQIWIPGAPEGDRLQRGFLDNATAEPKSGNSPAPATPQFANAGEAATVSQNAATPARDRTRPLEALASKGTEGSEPLLALAGAFPEKAKTVLAASAALRRAAWEAAGGVAQMPAPAPELRTPTAPAVPQIGAPVEKVSEDGFEDGLEKDTAAATANSGQHLWQDPAPSAHSATEPPGAGAEVAVRPARKIASGPAKTDAAGETASGGDRGARAAASVSEQPEALASEQANHLVLAAAHAGRHLEAKPAARNSIPTDAVPASAVRELPASPLREAWQALQARMGARAASVPLVNSANAEMQLRLHSQVLGDVQLHATMRDGLFGAAIAVSDDGAREVLAREMPALHAALGNRAVAIESLSVVQEQPLAGAGGSPLDFASSGFSQWAGDARGETPQQPQQLAASGGGAEQVRLVDSAEEPVSEPAGRRLSIRV